MASINLIESSSNDIMGEQVAVFIQASTQSIGGQFAHNLWKHRALPIAHTWAARTRNSFFVLGSSSSNHDYVQSCEKNSLSHSAYVLAFTCDDIKVVAPTVNVLYIQNCTDKYAGLSQTCRLQETMRFFISDISMRNMKWYLLFDDDNFVRMEALNAFLGSINSLRPLAFGGCAYQSAGLVFAKNYSQCATDKQHMPKFCWAQPVVMNRMAVNHLQSALDTNMLTELWAIWGETHDVLSGLVLWLYDIDTFSLLRNMFKPYAIYNDDFIKSRAGVDLNISKFIIFHQVKPQFTNQFEMFEYFYRGVNASNNAKYSSMLVSGRLDDVSTVARGDEMSSGPLQEEVAVGKWYARHFLTHIQNTSHRGTVPVDAFGFPIPHNLNDVIDSSENRVVRDQYRRYVLGIASTSCSSRSSNNWAHLFCLRRHGTHDVRPFAPRDCYQNITKTYLEKAPVAVLCIFFLMLCICLKRWVGIVTHTYSRKNYQRHFSCLPYNNQKGDE